MPTDAELLLRYARENDGRAFAELVQRHLGLVYATAQRGAGGRAHLAEEIAQKVFTDLARKSASLCHHPALTAWLYRSASHAAKAVARAELRRQKFNQTLAVMPDNASPSDPSLDWERLRPVLDEIMEELKERDRELMLLRFFEGLGFAEIGTRLNLSENAARMRTERALDKLRSRLERRGVTSTSAALGILMANQVFATAPAGLAAAVTTTSLATVPATGGIMSFLLMNKLAIPALSFSLAAGLTVLTWSAVASDVSPEELIALRAENVRLKQALAVGTATAAVAAVPDDPAAQMTGIVQAIRERLVQKKSGYLGKHRYHGQATPYEAFLTYAWAIDAGEFETLENILTYDDKGRAAIQTLYASMPATIRASYPTPEKFMVFLYLADTLLNPVPGVDMTEQFVATEISPGVAAVRRKEAKGGGMKWVQTGDVWKVVVPDKYPDHIAKRILGNEILDKLGLK